MADVAVSGGGDAPSPVAAPASPSASGGEIQAPSAAAAHTGGSKLASSGTAGSASTGGVTLRLPATATAPQLVDEARRAFSTGDAEASRAVHDQKAAVLAAEEKHGGTGSDYIKSIVFGGLDGIITTFAIVSSAVGASLPVQVVILSGFAKLLGDGLAMGLGDCMSEQAEHNHIRGERNREVWEYDNHPDGEREEMIDIYVEKGFSREEATRIITLMTKKQEYKDFFVDHMMVQELGQMVPGEDDNPMKDGAVTFGSFLAFGSIPLWAYLIFYGAKYHDTGGMFGICIAVTAVCLFALGALQARIINQHWAKQGTLMTINGGLAAAAAYLVGWGLQSITGSPCA